MAAKTEMWLSTRGSYLANMGQNRPDSEVNKLDLEGNRPKSVGDSESDARSGSLMGDDSGAGQEEQRKANEGSESSENSEKEEMGEEKEERKEGMEEKEDEEEEERKEDEKEEEQEENEKQRKEEEKERKDEELDQAEDERDEDGDMRRCLHIAHCCLQEVHSVTLLRVDYVSACQLTTVKHDVHGLNFLSINLLFFLFSMTVTLPGVRPVVPL